MNSKESANEGSDGDFGERAREREKNGREDFF